MRLTKTLFTIEVTQDYLRDENGDIIRDQDGRPVFGETETRTPFLGEIQPYSARLAETTYGVMVDVQNRVFCYPNEKLTLGTSIEYKGKKFEVTECMDYETHYEVLMKKVFS